MIKSWNDMGMV